MMPITSSSSSTTSAAFSSASAADGELPVALSVLGTAPRQVWVITITRPHVRNAVNRATADALTAAFNAFNADAGAAVAVLTGSDGHFCAGADLKALAASAGDGDDGSGGAGATNRLGPVGEGDGPMGPTRLLLNKPVIAAIAGAAVAGGLELAVWADLRVAEADAVLGVSCRQWGVPLIDGGTVRLPRLIGRSRALDLIRTYRIDI